MITPAIDEPTFGVTVIETLLPGATVPPLGDRESKVDGFASSEIAQFSGTLPGLDRVNACCAGLLPWIALNVSALVVIAMAGRGAGPTVRMGEGLGVTVADRLVTLIVTFSVKGVFVPCWKKLI